MVKVFGFLNIEARMQINMRVSDDYCQGADNYLELLEPEEYEFPPEELKVKSVRIKRERNK